MKVMFDTNVDLAFIRDRSHAGELQFRSTVKYISAVTLMELWAGAKIKKAERLVFQLQKPYLDARRIVTLDAGHTISQWVVSFPDFPVNMTNWRRWRGL